MQLWQSLPCGTRMTCWPCPSPWPGILKGGNGACGEPNCVFMGVRALAVRAVLRSVVKRSLPAPCASMSFVLGISASVRGHGDSRWTYGGYVRVRGGGCIGGWLTELDLVEALGLLGLMLVRLVVLAAHGAALGDTRSGSWRWDQRIWDAEQRHTSERVSGHRAPRDANAKRGVR